MPALLRRTLTFVVALAIGTACVPAQPAHAAAQVPAPPPGESQADQDARELQALYVQLEEAIGTVDRDKLRATFSPRLPEGQAIAFTGDLLWPENTRATVKERDRVVLPDAPPGTGFRLVLEIFVEAGNAGRIATYRVDLLRALPDRRWTIATVEQMTRVDGLFRLSLDASRQIAVRNLVVTAEDYQLSLPSGTAFVATLGGSDVTAVVLLGDGTMTFSPAVPAERVQVKLFCGQETLTAPFTMAFLRFNPGNLENFLNKGGLAQDGPADPRQLARATEFFTAQLPRSFSLDLSDLSRETWSLVPGPGDLVAEVRTRKHGVLTYARSNGEAEDITLFDRALRRNIAVYPSAQRLQARGGRTYNEDLLADFDVVNYVVDASYVPERAWLEGQTRMQLRVRSVALSTLTLRLAGPLVVRSVQSDRDGRLLTIRVRDQNNILVSLPKPASRDDLITLTVTYGGRLEAQPPDREVVTASGEQVLSQSDMPQIQPEPRWVLSNRSYWYPQNTVTDYATGVLRLVVPGNYESLASGDFNPANPSVETGTGRGDAGRRVYEFRVVQPARYFSWLITRLVTVGAVEAKLPDVPPPAPPETLDNQNGRARGLHLDSEYPPLPGAYYRAMDVIALANPRQVNRARTLLPVAAEMFSFYGSLVDDLPYPSFALAILDDDVPGGHSPAYMGLVNQPLPTSGFSWRNDPAYFDDFPRFYLAHEVAHQFWGQAVGWKSYHEQWISEGFAQYFALLYAERFGSPGAARSVRSRLRNTALSQAGQGPIELGYRLGHIKDDSRVFRSIVYNKAAMVLDMLRRWLGDDAFFRGLRRFYKDSRFLKAGTDEVRAAFEAESGRDLSRFFQRWVREYAIPRVTYSTSIQGDVLSVSLEQDAAAIHDVPVTVSITYASGERQDVVVALAEAKTSARLPLSGPVRSVEVNDDNGALARFERR